MDFAWVCLRTSYEDGRIDTTAWRTPSVKRNLSHMTIVTLPFGNGQTGVSLELEVAISGGSSLEAAGRRVSLFGRLIEERDLHSVLSQRPQTQQVEAFHQVNCGACDAGERGTYALHVGGDSAKRGL